MDYWITLKIRAQKTDGTTIFKEDLLLTYSQGLKSVVAGLRQKIADILKRAWNACSEDELDEQARLRIKVKEEKGYELEVSQDFQ